MPNLATLNDALNKAQTAINEALQQQQALTTQLHQTSSIDPTIMLLTVFILACFVGYYVVWKVTPALHTPLMSVTNAISGIIVVGAIIAVGPSEGSTLSRSVGFFAVVIASINIFGGFLVTQRMLDMYRKKDAPK
jgi:NAD(P) transhydrogenase subunit alpha